MNINNLMMNNSISYKIISANQKIENDKERIKSKFNFNITRSSTNSSAIKRSSLPTQQNSIITTNKNLKINDNICQNNDKKNNVVKKIFQINLLINSNKIILKKTKNS